MVKIGPPGPKVNTLDLDPTIAYADTMIEVLQIMKFFLDELLPVETDALEPEDRKCPICGEDYTRDSHHAVRTPCAHYFGESCIRTWLSPFLPWARGVENPFRREARPPGANTCPTCRRTCFPDQSVADCLPEIDARIRLWDYAYARAGIALSDRETQARELLLRYIEDHRARGLDEFYPSDETMAQYPRITSIRLVTSVLALDFVPLPSQHQHALLRRLRDLAEELDPDDMVWRRNELGTLVFEYEGGWVTEEEEEGGWVSEEEEEEGSEEEGEEEGEVEEEEEIEDDSEEMRFFRALLR